jgi:hypothetical protein
MVRIVKHGRGLLVVLALLAIAVSACSSDVGSKSSNAASQRAGQSQAAASQGTDGGNISGAAAALENITSYKFSMTLAGGQFATLTTLLGGTGTSGAVTLSGTIVVKPEKAADITIAPWHIIEVGGVDYTDLSGTGSYVSSPASDTSMAKSLSPAEMFSGALGVFSAGDFNKVGTEQKNDVSADHYVATEAALAKLGQRGVAPGATWTAEIWIAKDGGYPGSMKIIATMPDQSIGYEMLFDLTNVNDPANKVTAPAV